MEHDDDNTERPMTPLDREINALMWKRFCIGISHTERKHLERLQRERAEVEGQVETEDET